MNILKEINLLIFAAAAFAVSLPATADDDTVSRQSLTDIETLQEIELLPCNDPVLDWSQFKEKTISSRVTNKGLEIISKDDSKYSMSFCEISCIGIEHDDFAVRFRMIPTAFSDEKPFGIVYDVENEDNYRMLLIFKNQYQRAIVKDGKITVEKKDLFKKTKNSKDIEIALVRQQGRLYFFINSLELKNTKSPDMENATFGFIVGPKNKLTCTHFGYRNYPPLSNDESN